MSSNPYHTPQPTSERAQSEIALSEIGVSDRITIQTKNSTYIFLITEPAARRGMLYAQPRAARPPVGRQHDAPRQSQF